MIKYFKCLQKGVLGCLSKNQKKLHFTAEAGKGKGFNVESLKLLLFSKMCK